MEETRGSNPEPTPNWLLNISEGVHTETHLKITLHRFCFCICLFWPICITSKKLHWCSIVAYKIGLVWYSRALVWRKESFHHSCTSFAQPFFVFTVCLSPAEVVVVGAECWPATITQSFFVFSFFFGRLRLSTQLIICLHSFLWVLHQTENIMELLLWCESLCQISWLKLGFIYLLILWEKVIF